MLSNKNVINNVFKIKQPYNVNLAAEIAAITTLKNKDKLIINIEKILSERKNFEEFIENNNKISSFKSDGNFILCKFNNNDAEIVFNNLAKEGIFVRKFSDNLLKNYLRISIGKPDQMNKLKNIINNSL